MPIRAEVGLEMVLNMGERREERRLWRLGGIMGVFLVVFVWDMRIWTNARDERRQQEGGGTTTTEENRKSHVM